ncbi:MAG: osmotically inducible protein C, partial [Alphaproteobacteria bacterium]
MRSEKFSFEGHDGSTLSGRLDMPDGPVRATALFAHCFTCTANILP